MDVGHGVARVVGLCRSHADIAVAVVVLPDPDHHCGVEVLSAAAPEAVAELLGQVLDLTRRDELPAQEPRAPGAVYVRRPAEVEDDGHRRRSLAALVGGFDFLPESAPLVE